MNYFGKFLVAFSVFLINLMVTTQDVRDCYQTSASFSYRIRDDSSTQCLTCVEFKTITQEYTLGTCVIQGDILDEIIFGKVENDIVNYNTRGLRLRFEDLVNSSGNYMKSGGSAFNSRIANIEVFNVSDSYIISVASGFFQNLFNLIILDLSDNIISDFQPEVFRELTKLQVLILHHNKIETLDEDVFAPLIDLFEIDLSYNKLSYISSKLFQHQTHLSKVLLNHNHLSQVVCICWNSINYVIDVVDLSSNALINIELNSEVKNLTLSNNYITEFTTSLSSSVQFLNLSYNHISNVSENVFLNAYNMSIISLSNNKLKSLPTSSMRFMERLEFLDISNNLLSKNSFGPDDNWISLFLHWNNLQNISLHDNLWTCVDLANMVQSLHFRSVNIARGNIYTKNNILGIYCIELNTKNSTDEATKNSVNQVLEEVWLRLANNSIIEKEIIYNSNRIKDLQLTFETFVSNITGVKKELAIQRYFNDSNFFSNATANLNTELNAKVEKIEIELQDFSNAKNICLAHIEALQLSVKNLETKLRTFSVKEKSVDISSEKSREEQHSQERKSTDVSQNDNFISYPEILHTETVKLFNDLIDLRLMPRREIKYNIDTTRIEQLLQQNVNVNTKTVPVMEIITNILLLVVVISLLVLVYFIFQQNKIRSNGTFNLVQM